jgi:hypothetical protein
LEATLGATLTRLGDGDALGLSVPDGLVLAEPLEAADAGVVGVAPEECVGGEVTAADLVDLGTSA